MIRATNLYGDPRPWSPQSSVLFSVFSFVNTTKYPVSLMYLLMTIGPALLALAWFESRQSNGQSSRLEHGITQVGRVPLFFYLWQWPLAHGIAVLVSAAYGMPVGHYFLSPPAVFSVQITSTTKDSRSPFLRLKVASTICAFKGSTCSNEMAVDEICRVRPGTVGAASKLESSFTLPTGVSSRGYSPRSCASRCRLGKLVLLEASRR